MRSPASVFSTGNTQDGFPIHIVELSGQTHILRMIQIRPSTDSKAFCIAQQKFLGNRDKEIEIVSDRISKRFIQLLALPTEEESNSQHRHQHQPKPTTTYHVKNTQIPFHSFQRKNLIEVISMVDAEHFWQKSIHSRLKALGLYNINIGARE